MSEEIEPIVKDEEQPTTLGANNTNEVVDELEADFEKFNQTHTDNEAQQEAQQADENEPIEIDLSDAENFKLQIFLSLMFALLDGLHVFIYKFISKYKISREDIALDESDKAGLEIYFRTQKVMDLINRLPVEVIGFLHIEYMYFNKFQDFKKQKEVEEEQEEEEEEEEQEEQEEQEENEAATKAEEKKAALKKAAPKKAAAKKIPAKKAAAKKKPAKKAATKTIEEKK